MKKFGSSGKSYSDLLTILLVIIILAILGLMGYFGYKAYNKKSVDTKAQTSYEQFINSRPKPVAKTNKNTTEVDSGEEERADISGMVDTTPSPSEVSQNPEEYTERTSQRGSTTETRERPAKQYLDAYEIIGAIDIPKTKCQYPILGKLTVDSLTKSVAVLDIVSNPELGKVIDLNVPGTNAFILGHNYRNGQFFSNNENLATGDKIYITDVFGDKIEYTIYTMYYTSSDDASFMGRELDPNVREITLQTCNDDSSQRLIIQARDTGL